MKSGDVAPDSAPDPIPGSMAEEGMTAEQYARHQRGRRRTVRRDSGKKLRLIARYGGPGPVLDVGTGPGIVLRELARRLPPGTAIHGIDVDPSMIDLAREELADFPGVQLARVDAQGILPFADEEFAIVHSEYCFHHLRDLESTALEIRRVLRPNGLLLLVDIDPRNWMSRLFRRLYPAWRAARLGWPVADAAYHSIQRARSFDSLIDLLNRSGFRVRYQRRSRIRRLVAAVKAPRAAAGQ